MSDDEDDIEPADDELLIDEAPEDEMAIALEKDDVGESDDEDEVDLEELENVETASVSNSIIKVQRLPPGVVNKKTETRVILIPKDKRTCSDYINQQELTAVIAMRGEQIAKSGVSYIESDSVDPIQRAKLEILQRRCPIIIRRRVDIAGIYEDWDVNELHIPPITL
jgi:DNA-directed RNA polymerase subunit K/omega